MENTLEKLVRKYENFKKCRYVATSCILEVYPPALISPRTVHLMFQGLTSQVAG